MRGSVIERTGERTPLFEQSAIGPVAELLAARHQVTDTLLHRTAAIWPAVRHAPSAMDKHCDVAVAGPELARIQRYQRIAHEDPLAGARRLPDRCAQQSVEKAKLAGDAKRVRHTGDLERQGYPTLADACPACAQGGGRVGVAQNNAFDTIGTDDDMGYARPVTEMHIAAVMRLGPLGCRVEGGCVCAYGPAQRGLRRRHRRVYKRDRYPICLSAWGRGGDATGGIRI